MTINSTNQISEGEVLYNESAQSGYVYMLLKGRLELFNRGTCVSVGAGTLLGTEQLGGDESCYGVRAAENASVYAVSAESDKGFTNLLAANKDYSGIAVYNHARLIYELVKNYNALTACAERIYNDTKSYYDKYIRACNRIKCKAVPMPEITQLKAWEPVDGPDLDRAAVKYDCLKIPYDVVKAFYGASVPLAREAVKEAVMLETELFEAAGAVSDYIAGVFTLLVGDADYSVYRNLLGLIADAQKSNAEIEEIAELADNCLAYLDSVSELIGRRTSRYWYIDEEEIRGYRDKVLGGGDFRSEAEEKAAVDVDVAVQAASLKDSFEQITAFGNYGEKAADFKALLERFAAIGDKSSTDDESRKIRKGITDHFYNLYLQVFLNSIEAQTVPKAVDLFLNYGFISEKLLHEDQINEILSIRDPHVNEPCSVYTMREWLMLIYNGRKQPSRNDMGQDYTDVLREMKKSGTIDEAQEKELLNNAEHKVEHEIRSVMVPASRIVNGQLLVFVPILYAEAFVGSVTRQAITSARINKAFSDVRTIDYSAFYREALYTDPARGIEREYEMKEVLPVIIMYPTVGQNVIMWQEITGRKRDSEGRFFTPSFSFVSLNDMFIKAFGQFRWALCKTIQGTNWNNIQVRSLTAEYSDYIQFYKKNRELSDERKEKLKLQIQHGRNNLREIFTMDYETWIKTESTGAMRLNKVAREMLATYCPFAAELRANLTRQIAFEDAFARNVRERTKKVHELELRYKALENKGVVLPDELKNTMEFYKSL